MRAHCKQHPPSGSKSKKLSEATLRILAKECKVVADFTVPPALLEPKKKIARFPPNPGEFDMINKCVMCVDCVMFSFACVLQVCIGIDILYHFRKFI